MGIYFLLFYKESESGKCRYLNIYGRGIRKIELFDFFILISKVIKHILVDLNLTLNLLTWYHICSVMVNKYEVN